MNSFVSSAHSLKFTPKGSPWEAKKYGVLLAAPPIIYKGYDLKPFLQQNINKTESRKYLQHTNHIRQQTFNSRNVEIEIIKLTRFLDEVKRLDYKFQL